MYRVRSKHPGNEMGSWEHGCSEVRIEQHRDSDWQEETQKGCLKDSRVPL